jgi:hypothetical protein
LSAITVGARKLYGYNPIIPTMGVDNHTILSTPRAKKIAQIGLNRVFYRKWDIFQLFLKKAVDNEHLLRYSSIPIDLMIYGFDT